MNHSLSISKLCWRRIHILYTSDGKIVGRISFKPMPRTISGISQRGTPVTTLYLGYESSSPHHLTGCKAPDRIASKHPTKISGQNSSSLCFPNIFEHHQCQFRKVWNAPRADFPILYVRRRVCPTWIILTGQCFMQYNLAIWPT